jgi:SAM-dependent methyltransferase
VSATAIEHSVAFHDAECGGYRADLEIWERLTAGLDGPLAELGAGTGRVSLHLAALGRPVVAVDCDAALLSALERRAEAAGLEVGVQHSDASELRAPEPLAAVIAPMQFLQLLPPQARARVLEAVARALRPGGRLAAAILGEETPAGPGAAKPLPDVREVEGWIHSSLPLDVRAEPDGLLIRRLRQTVSPRGELSDEVDETRLWRLEAGRLEAEAAEAGLAAIARVGVPPTRDHVASQIVVVEARR